jgi:hypothetical protein
VKIKEGESVTNFFERLHQWLRDLHPYHERQCEECYQVRHNLTEVMVDETMYGPLSIRFRLEFSFEYLEFLGIYGTMSQITQAWLDILDQFTDRCTLITTFPSDAGTVAYVPGLLLEHGFQDASRELTSIPSLLSPEMYVDFLSLTWYDGAQPFEV